ncbi:MAG: hypothetical protein KA144_10490 [Xanthomonadaceae bacterium]|nr:hypothetical protein [Xanthomonadaceae bacterium]
MPLRGATIRVRGAFALVVASIGLPAAATDASACLAPAREAATLHWSEPARVVSPSRVWAIEVDARAGLRSDDNETPVALIRCSDGRRVPLFVLTRAARMQWSPRGNRLLVLDRPGAGHHELRFYDAERIAGRRSANDADRIDSVVRDAVRDRLGPTNTIAFYTASVAAWRNDRLTLSIALQAANGATGPLRPFCYGVVLDTSAMAVEAVLSETETKKRYPNATCRMTR